MGLAAVTAAALTDHSARSKMLALGGVDLVKEPGVLGLGIPIESVEVTEAGFGGQSSITFSIDDPRKSLDINDGDEIRFHDLVADAPLFFGVVQDWKESPAFGDQGRIFSVTGVGYDALPDWIRIQSLTIPAGTNFADAVQAAVAAGIGVGPLRAFQAGGQSTQASPIADFRIAGPTYLRLLVAVTLTNVTLRQAIAQLFAASGNVKYGDFYSAADVTVDGYLGLRVTGAVPFDWTSLTVSDAGPIRPESLEHRTNAGSIVRAVAITGGAPAGTGVVNDGTGRPGRVDGINDPLSLTADDLAARGAAYLLPYRIAVRGSFQLIDWTPSASTIHAGSQVTITSAAVGLAGSTYVIGSITKRFHAVRQDWTVEYGGLPPSLVRSIRRLLS